MSTLPGTDDNPTPDTITPDTAASTDAPRAWLALLLTPGIGAVLAARLVDHFGSPHAMLDAPPTALANIRGISKHRSAELHRHLRHAYDDLAPRELDAVAALPDTRLLVIDQPDYPAPLRLIPDPPPLLWVRGRLSPRDALAIAVVGSRQATQYGREQAARFAAHLADAGLTLASGGALGVDTAAHRAALQAQGRTLAVIGSGLHHPYPNANRALFDQIVHDDAGALLAELPLDTPPAAEHFPRRNRIISGLSLGTLVIEAAARSGALITARVAVEEHGRDCFALPGRVDAPASAGCHRLIRAGAAELVTSPNDLLDRLHDAGHTLTAAEEHTPPQAAPERSEAAVPTTATTTTQQQLLAALDGPTSLDQLTARTGLATHAAQAELTVLEIQGHVTRRDGLYHPRRN
ncbi:MAG: DNA-processing protein DprA [Planctomycetota bacterium]